MQTKTKGLPAIINAGGEYGYIGKFSFTNTGTAKHYMEHQEHKQDVVQTSLVKS